MDAAIRGSGGTSLFPIQMGRVLPEQLTESGRLDMVRDGLERILVRVGPGAKALLGVGLAERFGVTGEYAGVMSQNAVWGAGRVAFR